MATISAASSSSSSSSSGAMPTGAAAQPTSSAGPQAGVFQPESVEFKLNVERKITDFAPRKYFAKPAAAPAPAQAEGKKNEAGAESAAAAVETKAAAAAEQKQEETAEPVEGGEAPSTGPGRRGKYRRAKEPHDKEYNAAHTALCTLLRQHPEVEFVLPPGKKQHAGGMLKDQKCSLDLLVALSREVLARVPDMFADFLAFHNGDAAAATIGVLAWVEFHGNHYAPGPDVIRNKQTRLLRTAMAPPTAEDRPRRRSMVDEDAEDDEDLIPNDDLYLDPPRREAWPLGASSSATVPAPGPRVATAPPAVHRSSTARMNASTGPGPMRAELPTAPPRGKYPRSGSRYAPKSGHRDSSRSPLRDGDSTESYASESSSSSSSSSEEEQQARSHKRKSTGSAAGSGSKRARRDRRDRKKRE